MALIAGLSNARDQSLALKVRLVSSDPAAGPPRILQEDREVPEARSTPVPVPQALQDPDLQAMFPRKVFEIENLPADTDLTIELGSERCRIRTLPPAEKEVRILLGSCFYQNDDRGRLRDGASSLRGLFEKPHLRLLCGDQLYMDVPGFTSGAKESTLERYRRTWEDPAHSEFLSDGLTLFSPDDHEFWNDYPHKPLWLSRTWTAASRVEHARYAGAGFLAHQALANPEGRTWFTLDLGLVSLFVTDTRSEREPAGGRLMSQKQEEELLQWSDGLRKPGILVLGPPLFQKPVGKILILKTDHNILSYPREAALIWRAVESAAREVMVLAGDIHMSRLSEWTAPNGRVLREVVASPMSVIPRLPLETRDIQPPPNDLRPDGDASQRRIPVMKYATRVNGFTLISLTGSNGVLVRVQAREAPSGRIATSGWEPGGACMATFTLR